MVLMSILIAPKAFVFDDAHDFKMQPTNQCVQNE